MNVFELKNVFFSYRPEHRVFADINLAIAKGRFLAMVGPNGAGKSTLLKLCAGLLRPDQGQVSIFNTPIEQFRGWFQIAYIAQQSLRDRNFPVTVQEVVRLGRVAPAGIGARLKSADEEIVEEAIHTVGLQDLRKRLIGELSGGQQQRVAIARALAAQPAVLLMDEAASGVDTATREHIYGLLQAINRTAGTSILMVSHDVERILHYADDIAGIDRGGVGYYGNAAGFRQFCRVQPEPYAGEAEGGQISHA
ncbi:metal ABC transporter ATP-binding protein|uniref:metal ABC transporter ATP-binding protein n=1 Tax=Dendrosporobacter quercicolus TaxID=146817 RepID=UPI000B849F1C|nr:metal ABC transporter ATP-binding protein [Dendrosporobacter quercicolus]NSL48296.1 metal ABC transporter ATP-binding protein [Dendrosporobacter quercicolus DSM 1736]